MVPLFLYSQVKWYVKVTAQNNNEDKWRLFSLFSQNFQISYTRHFLFAARFAEIFRSGAFPKFYWGKLQSPLWRGAFPLKHLYSFKLHCSLLMCADLSWYLVAVDQVLILQCNLMLRARTVCASNPIWKDWLFTTVACLESLLENLCSMLQPHVNHR